MRIRVELKYSGMHMPPNWKPGSMSSRNHIMSSNGGKDRHHQTTGTRWTHTQAARLSGRRAQHLTSVINFSLPFCICCYYLLFAFGNPWLYCLVVEVLNSLWIIRYWISAHTALMTLVHRTCRRKTSQVAKLSTEPQSIVVLLVWLTVPYKSGGPEAATQATTRLTKPNKTHT